jgi:hypothetical protein
MRLASGVTDQYVYFVAVDATDLKTRETGLSSFTVYRSRNGGAAVAMTTPTVNETDATNMPGVYELLLDEDMTIDSGDDTQEMVYHITHAGMAPVTRVIELFRPAVTVDAASLTAISDAILSRNVSNVESTMGEHTLGTIVLAVLEYSVSGTTWTIKRTDGTTTHATKTLTTEANADSITGVT